MKRRFLILIAIAAFATILTANASGQTIKTTRSNVKFDFQIGDDAYPAGEYQFESISGAGDNIFLIRSVGGTNNCRIIIANHLNAGKRQAPALVFRKYGGGYFLTQIFLESGQWGYSIRPSRRQRESEKDLALASLKKD
jgi:hypothetical protein